MNPRDLHPAARNLLLVAGDRPQQVTALLHLLACRRVPLGYLRRVYHAQARHLAGLGLLAYTPRGKRALYTITPAGRAVAEALLSAHLPRSA